MLQGENLLAGYAQNPNQDAGDRQAYADTDYTPNLTQSQINLQRKEKKVTMIFGVCIAILVALLLGILGYTFFQHYQRDRPVVPEPDVEPIVIDDTCENCLNLEDLKRRAADSIESAKDYIQGKIGTVTNIIDLKEDEDELAKIEKYAESMKGNADLKNRLDDLLQRWKRLQDDLVKAAETNQNVSDLRASYNAKVLEIRRLKEQVLEAIQNALNADNNKRDLQSQIYQTQKDIDANKDKLRSQRGPLLEEIAQLEGGIQRIFDRTRTSSLAALDKEIYDLKQRIDHRDDEKKSCAENIDRDSDHISNLYGRLTQELTKLGDIEVELIHCNWVQHVNETINKFKAIQEELRVLKRTQLDDGQQNLFQAILALEKKEITIAQILKELYEGESLTIEEERLLDAKNVKIDQTTVTSKTLSIKRARAFQRYIETGKDELKVWGRQQFNTTYVTMKDIEDLNDIIEYFTKTLKDYPLSSDLLAIQKEEQEKIVNGIRQQIEELENSIKRCQGLIKDSEAVAIQDAEKLRVLEKAREEIQNLNSELERKRRELSELETKSANELSELERKKRDLESRLAQFDDTYAKERRLRELTNQINDKISASPNVEDIEKASRQHQANVNKAAEAHREFEDLFSRIKATI